MLGLLYILGCFLITSLALGFGNGAEWPEWMNISLVAVFYPFVSMVYFDYFQIIFAASSK